MRSISSIPLLVVLACAVIASLSCTKAINYAEPQGPRFGGTAPMRPDPEDAIRVVTFNVKYAENVRGAAALLREEPDLRDTDIVFLQEMDEPGARTIAGALSMNWVYYPAVVHDKTGRDFGNAILSRWPIVEDHKIILPHRGRFNHSQRIATEASIEIDGRRVRLYSTHLALPLLVMPHARQEQAERILHDILEGGDPAIVAGDLNGQKIGHVFEDAGLSWPTRNLGKTSGNFDLDHIFMRGFQLAHDPPVGLVLDNRGVSDHRPVWAVVRLAPSVASTRRVESTEPVALTEPAAPLAEEDAPAGRAFAVLDPSLGIKNAAWISPTLLRGGRPKPAGLATLKARGFKTIVNFTKDPKERREAGRLGLEYYELPITASLWSTPPTETQVREFFHLALDPARRPLFFHCAHGRDRTGLMAALYRIEAEGWPNGEAIAEMQALGYKDWFKDLIAYARTYVPGRYGPYREPPNSAGTSGAAPR